MKTESEMPSGLENSRKKPVLASEPRKSLGAGSARCVQRQTMIFLEKRKSICLSLIYDEYLQAYLNLLIRSLNVIFNIE